MERRISVGLKGILRNLAALCFGFLLVLVALEVLFRFLPVAGGHYIDPPVNENNPVIRFSPKNDTIIWSLGWNFYHVAKKRINNEGFFNNEDYVENPDNPVIAVIGDSYVEALQVDNEETFFGILQSEVKDFSFYSFSASGSQLPTYLAYTKYSLKYKPKKFVFVIVDNDFDESFYPFRSKVAFWYFSYNGGLYLASYDPSKHIIKRLRNFLRRSSALLRYLYFNAGLPYTIRKLQSLTDRFMAKDNNTYNDKFRIVRGKQAIDLFFKYLPQYTHHIDPKNIIFIIDAPRYYIYKNDPEGAKKSYFGIMRDYFMSKAKEGGYTVIDMMPVFFEHYKKHHKRFEFPTDGHWNELGHKLVAMELKKILEK